MNKEYSDEDDDFVEIEPEEWEIIAEDSKYQTFELWENLKNLDRWTLRLLSKGFIERITNESLITAISGLAKGCRKIYKEDFWLTHKVADYGENEFIGGKAEAFEDCLWLIREFNEF